MFTIERASQKAINRSFKKLGVTIGKKPVRKGLRAGAKILNNQVKQNINSDSGQLKRNCKVRAGKRSRKMISVNSVCSFNSSETFYGSFVNYGTKNIKPQNFIGSAWDSKHKQATKTIVDTINSEANKLL